MALAAARHCLVRLRYAVASGPLQAGVAAAASRSFRLQSDSFALGRRKWGLTGENLDHALTFGYETQEDVLGTDVVVPQLERLTQGQLEDLLGPGCKGWRADGRRAAGPMVSFTRSRTSSRRTPSWLSALRPLRRSRVASQAASARCRGSCARECAPPLGQGRGPFGHGR